LVYNLKYKINALESIQLLRKDHRNKTGKGINFLTEEFQMIDTDNSPVDGTKSPHPLK